MSQATQGRQQRQPAAQPTQEKPVDPNAALLDDIMARTVASIDTAATRFSKEIADPGIGQLMRAAKKGAAIARLRSMLTGQLLSVLKSLMGSPMGFLTDKDRKGEPYGDDVIRDCAIEALLNGVLWDGNEFNIISGKAYITQAGYWRKVREITGISDIDVTPGVPALHNGTMVCRVRANWKIDGVPNSLIGADGQAGRVFPIKADAGSTVDNLIGKALRKAYKAIYEKATGSVASAPDDGDVSDSQPQSEAAPAPIPTSRGNVNGAAAKPIPAAIVPASPAVWAPASQEQIEQVEVDTSIAGLTIKEALAGHLDTTGSQISSVVQLSATQASEVLAKLANVMEAQRMQDQAEVG